MSHVLGIIIGTVIGSGVFINLPIVQRATGSPLLAVLAWFIGGLIWLPQIFILSEMGTAYPKQGFGYLYLQKAGSPFLAFLYVWTVFWTSDTPSITILAMASVAALDIFFPVLTDSIWTRFFAILIILVLTGVHIKSVRQGGRLQVVLTILKISPLILLSCIGLGFLNSDTLFFIPEGFTTDQPIGWFALIAAGVSATIWSYAGFPNILYMAGEIKNPRETLPKALLGSTIFVTLTYTAVAFATGAIVPMRYSLPFQVVLPIPSDIYPFLLLLPEVSWPSPLLYPWWEQRMPASWYSQEFNMQWPKINSFSAFLVNFTHASVPLTRLFSSSLSWPSSLSLHQAALVICWVISPFLTSSKTSSSMLPFSG
jgi:amino acid transporter